MDAALFLNGLAKVLWRAGPGSMLSISSLPCARETNKEYEVPSINLGPLAVSLGQLFVLAALLVAAGVGRLAGRREQVGIGPVLLDMLLAALLAARLVFVAIWFDAYRASPWSMLDIRDGGFNVWAGLLAAVGVAAWRAWRHPALRRPLMVGLAAGAFAWAVLSGVTRALDAATHQTFPSVSLKTLAGESADIAAMTRGKPAVVNLWATWCPPCRREMPVLAAAQQQETEVNFVFVNQGEDAATAQRYLSQDQLSLSNVLLDISSGFGRAAGSAGLPTTLFYDASGRLVDTHLGALSAATLASKLKPLR
jgi:thiol-disulfide isomerase/thioredoxin